MKFAVAQISCSLGDPEANLIKVRDFSRLAKEARADWKPRAKSSHRTALVKMMICGFVAAPQSSIRAESWLQLHQQTAKSSFRLRP